MTEEKYNKIYTDLLVKPQIDELCFWNTKFVSPALLQVKETLDCNDNSFCYADHLIWEEYGIDLDRYKRILQYNKERELFLLINENNICTDSFYISSEDENVVKLDLIEILGEIKTTALGKVKKVIKIHNHPSGNINFSTGDEMSTFELSMLLRKCGVELVDSMLYAQDCFFSFAKIDEHLPINRKVLKYQPSDVVLETMKTDFKLAQMPVLLPDYDSKWQKTNKGNHIDAIKKITALSCELDKKEQNEIAEQLIQYGNFLKIHAKNKAQE